MNVDASKNGKHGPVDYEEIEIKKAKKIHKELNEIKE
jgi:hypothetical protein